VAGRPKRRAKLAALAEAPEPEVKAPKKRAAKPRPAPPPKLASPRRPAVATRVAERAAPTAAPTTGNRARTPARTRLRTRARTRPFAAPQWSAVITLELARQFAHELTSDLSHSVESASAECGLRARSVRDAIYRHERDECGTEEDREICGLLSAAKTAHIRELRRKAMLYAAAGNRAGCGHIQWQLEVQDPRNHPRTQRHELSGPEGEPVQVKSALLVLPDNGRLVDEEETG
jgi:hypothetical protein